MLRWAMEIELAVVLNVSDIGPGLVSISPDKINRVQQILCRNMTNVFLRKVLVYCIVSLRR